MGVNGSGVDGEEGLWLSLEGGDIAGSTRWL